MFGHLSTPTTFATASRVLQQWRRGNSSQFCLLGRIQCSSTVSPCASTSAKLPPPPRSWGSFYSSRWNSSSTTGRVIISHFDQNPVEGGYLQQQRHSLALPYTVLALAGPSGVGKTTVREELLRRYPQLFSTCISHTTRPPRQEEVHGKHYYFVSQAEFTQMITSKQLLEHVEMYGNFYGTSWNSISIAQTKSPCVLLVLDVRGCLAVQQHIPSALTLWLRSPNSTILRQRLRGRGSESEEQITLRLGLAEAEQAAESKFQKVIVQNDFRRTCELIYRLFVHPEAPEVQGRILSQQL